MSKSAFLAEISALPADLRAFFAQETAEPEFKDLQPGEYKVTIQGLKVLDSRIKDWKGTKKTKLPQYADFTPQIGCRLVSISGEGSIVHRFNLLAFTKWDDLSPDDQESGNYEPIDNYACKRDDDGELIRIPSEKGMNGVNNIQAQVAHALGMTGEKFAVALDKAMQNKVVFGIRVEPDPYDGRMYTKVKGFFPVKAEVEAEVDLDVTAM
jgi:hypothetical protein